MAPESEYTEALRGHMAHFALIVEREGQRLHGAGRPDNGARQLSALRILQSEAANVGLALDTALWLRDAGALVLIARYLYRYLSIKGEAAAARVSYHRLQAVAAQVPEEMCKQFKVLTDSGMLAALVRLGESQSARKLAGEILQLATELGDRIAEAHALRNLGIVEQGLGNFDQARCCQQQSLQAARAAGDTYGESAALSNLGLAAYSLAEHEEAGRLLGEALGSWRQQGDLYGEATALMNLGNLEAIRRNFERARQLFGDALAQSRRLGNRAGEAASLLGLGYVARGEKDYEDAAGHFQNSYNISRDLGDPQMQVAALANIATLEYERGRLAQAREVLVDAVQLASDLGHVRLLPYLCIPAAGVVAAGGDCSAAALLLLTALRLLSESAHLLEPDDEGMVDSVRKRIEASSAPQGPEPAELAAAGGWGISELASYALKCLVAANRVDTRELS